MLRKAVLALAMLAVISTPITARAEVASRRDHDHHEGSEHHEASEHHEPYYRYPIYGYYTPTCSWQGGSWEYQGPELGVDGNYYYVPRWVVPPQYVCG